MPAVVLGVYALVGVFHEVSAVRFWSTARKAAKAALMPVLGVFYLVGADDALVAVLVAIALSWLGDVFLIRKDEPAYFRLGMVAFLLSHVAYIAGLVTLTDSVHTTALVVSIAVAVVAEAVLPRIINPPKELRGAILVYGVVILAMSVCALQLLLADPSAATGLVFAGSIVFIVSDVLMTYLAFGTKPKHFDAITMAPYIIAQGLIVYGLAA
jgi:uncharacterized membrane protein YhhN